MMLRSVSILVVTLVAHSSPLYTNLLKSGTRALEDISETSSSRDEALRESNDTPISITDFVKRSTGSLLRHRNPLNDSTENVPSVKINITRRSSPILETDLLTLQLLLNSDPPMRDGRLFEVNIIASLPPMTERVELLFTQYEHLLPHMDRGEYYWSLGFLTENLLRKRNETVESQPIPSNCPFANYNAALDYIFEIKDVDYYANFSVENFVEEMVSQSKYGEIFRQYYSDTAHVYFFAALDIEGESESVDLPNIMTFQVEFDSQLDESNLAYGSDELRKNMHEINNSTSLAKEF